jgi:hypothetical protein
MISFYFLSSCANKSFPCGGSVETAFRLACFLG